MKILQISDVHLDMTATRLGKLKIHNGGNTTYKKRLNLLENAIYTGIENKVDIIAISGDLFHRNKPYPQEYSDAIQILDTVPRHVTTLIIAGNHDELTHRGCPIHLLAGRSASLYAHYEHSYCTISFDSQFKIVLAPWGVNLTDIKTENQILVSHCGVYTEDTHWVELDGENGNVRLGYLQNLNCKAILLGHHHNQTKLDNNIWYAGSLDVVNDFSEEGDNKGVLLWDIDKTVKVTPISTNPEIDKFKTYEAKEFLETKNNEFPGYVRVKGDVTEKERNQIVKKLQKFKCEDYKLDLRNSVRTNRVFNLKGTSQSDVLVNYFKSKDIKNYKELLEIDNKLCDQPISN